MAAPGAAVVGVYPKAIQYAVQKLVGFSKQTVKVLPQTPLSAAPGDTIIFQLPVNQMIDTSSVTVKGDLAISKAANSPLAAPRYAHSFVDFMDVQINGNSVDGSCTYYNQLYRILADYLAGDKIGQKLPLEVGGYTLASGAAPTNALPDIDFYSGTPPTATAVSLAAPNTDPNGTLTGVPWYLMGFPNFLGSQKAIDTSLTGDIRLLIRLAPNSILATTTGNTAAASYGIYNLSMLVDVWSVDDGVLYSLLQQRLQTTPISIPFHRWVGFTGPSFASSTSLRWAVNTQSLDMCLATFVPTNTFTSKVISAAFSGTPVPYFQHTAAGIGSLQWSVNSVQYPAYQQTVVEAWHQLLNTFATTDDVVGTINPAINSTNFFNQFFATGFRFSLPNEHGAPPFAPGIISGLDTRGQMSVGELAVVASSLNSTLASAPLTPYIWCRCSATYQVGQYRSGQIVV